MKVLPLQDWAVLRPAEAEAVSAGGLYIPDSAKEKTQEAVVEAIGPGAYEEEKFGKKKKGDKERRFIPTTIRPGDRVLYEKYADRSYTIDHEELVLVRERDILGILLERAAASRPLQIPAMTAGTGPVALVERDASSSANARTTKPAQETGKKGKKK